MTENGENSLGISITKRRRNGWQLPWDCMQILSWMWLISMLLVSCLLAIPLPHLPVTLAAIIMVYIWCGVWMLLLTSVDPSPSSARGIVPVTFDRAKHQHVIEKEYCWICRTRAPEGNKHCRICNKCVPLYDHHCRWLNTCVGARNYRLFIVLISSLTIASLCLFTFHLAAFIFAITKEENAGKDTSTALIPHSLQLFQEFVSPASVVWRLVTVFALACYLLVFAFSAHLMGFHIMLWKRKLTTLSYVQQRQQANRVTQEGIEGS